MELTGLDFGRRKSSAFARELLRASASKETRPDPKMLQTWLGAAAAIINGCVQSVAGVPGLILVQVVDDGRQVGAYTYPYAGPWQHAGVYWAGGVVGEAVKPLLEAREGAVFAGYAKYPGFCRVLVPSYRSDAEDHGSFWRKWTIATLAAKLHFEGTLFVLSRSCARALSTTTSGLGLE